MSLILSDPVNCLSATRFVKDEEPMEIDLSQPYYGAQSVRSLEGGGRSIHFLEDGSLVVAELDSVQHPAKRPCPEASPASSASTAADTPPSLDSTETPPPIANGPARLVISPSPMRQPQRPFKLLWCYSAGDADPNCACVLFVVDVQRAIYYGLSASNVCYGTSPTGTKPARGDWVTYDANPFKSQWTVAAISDRQHQAWCSMLLRNIFVSDPPADAIPLAQPRGLKFGTYHATIQSVTSTPDQHCLSLDCRTKIKLSTGALAVVNELPGFADDWKAGKGWARLNSVVLQGSFVYVSQGTYNLRGSIRFVMDIKQLEPHLGEFPAKVSTVLRALADSTV